MLTRIFEVLYDYVHTCLDSLYILWMVFFIFIISLSASAIAQSERITELERQIIRLENRIDTLTLEEEVEDVHTLQAINEPIAVIELPEYTEMDPCSTTSTFKSYMDYRTITNTSTEQWRLQQIAITGEDGMRYYEGRRMVAMADQTVGTLLEIEFEGQTIEVVVGDIKANTNCQHPDGSILEFIVDTNKMDGHIRRMGDYNHIFNGPIKMIRVFG